MSSGLDPPRDLGVKIGLYFCFMFVLTFLLLFVCLFVCCSSSSCFFYFFWGGGGQGFRVEDSRALACSSISCRTSGGYSQSDLPSKATPAKKRREALMANEPTNKGA